MRKKVFLLICFCGLLIALISYAEHKLTRAGSEPTPKSQATGTGSNQAWSWPDSLDAVTAAPKNHKVLLENDQVRVLDVTVPPHEKEPVHAHRWPSVLYIDKAGDFRDYDDKGNTIFDSRTVKEPIQYPLTQWMGPQSPHSVENLSDEPIHLIRVELKK